MEMSVRPFSLLAVAVLICTAKHACANSGSGAEPVPLILCSETAAEDVRSFVRLIIEGSNDMFPVDVLKELIANEATTHCGLNSCTQETNTLVFTSSNVQVCQESTNSGVFTIYVLIVYITIPNSQQLQQKNGPEVLSTTDLLEIMDGINPLFEATTDFTIIEVEGVNRAALSLKFILLIAGGAAGGAILAVVTCVVVIIIVVVCVAKGKRSKKIQPSETKERNKSPPSKDDSNVSTLKLT